MFPDRENICTEFKLSFTDDVIIALVAFANTQGGTVYVGMEDNGTIKGVALGKETVANWINTIKSKTIPALVPNVEIFNVQSKSVVAIQIPEYPIKPVSIKGRYYKRVENSNHLLDTTEITNLNLQSLQISWDSYTRQNIVFEDLDLQKITRFINSVNEKGRFRLDTEPLDALKKLKLITAKGEITNAAYLLFAKEPIGYNVHIGRFKTDSLIIGDKMINSSLFEAVEETMFYIVSLLKVAFEIKGVPIARTEIFEYPLPAIREIVLNSIIHRQYTSPIDIQIKVFDNQIMFYNPGTLYGGLKIEELKTGRYAAHTRNKLIAEAFYLVGEIEKYGSGFKRITDEIANYPTMSFSYDETSSGFEVLLNYKEQKVNDTLNDTLNDTILDIIRNNEGISATKIAELINKSHISTKRYVTVLKRQDVIEHRGSKKTGGYWIKKQS